MAAWVWIISAQVVQRITNCQFLVILFVWRQIVKMFQFIILILILRELLLICVSHYHICQIRII